MISQDKHRARIQFKLKVYEADGLDYERLFGQVMVYARPSFLKIKPYGNQGDRGNDGYEKDHGRYFQVYAPESSKHNLKKAIEKLIHDFEKKLKPHWNSICEIKEYFFVFNDKYKGSNFLIEKALSGIKNEHQLNIANVYLAKDLEDECLNLSDDKIFSITGLIPYVETKFNLEYSILHEVIHHILKKAPDFSVKTNMKAPDLNEKIKLNGLSSHYEGLLKSKQWETWLVDDYFSRNSQFAKQTLRNNLAALYAESLTQFNQDSLDKDSLGDLRFEFILKKITPLTNDIINDRLRAEAAKVIMTRYFERCDIFEEPV